MRDLRTRKIGQSKDFREQGVLGVGACLGDTVAREEERGRGTWW